MAECWGGIKDIMEGAVLIRRDEVLARVRIASVSMADTLEEVERDQRLMFKFDPPAFGSNSSRFLERLLS